MKIVEALKQETEKITRPIWEKSMYLKLPKASTDKWMVLFTPYFKPQRIYLFSDEFMSYEDYEVYEGKINEFEETLI